jgi:predicted amidophosphoribosyltransferase
MPLPLRREIVALVAPPRCAACGLYCEAAASICPACERELGAAIPLIEPGPPGVELSVAASRFEGVPRAVAHGIKFGRRLALAEVAARAMLCACPDDELRGSVVAVPAAPWRWRWRGFDPAEEIGLAVARLSGLPLRPCRRRGGGSRQVGRPRAERLADPPRVWSAGEVPAEAVLVDDVHTTGATLAACAAALRARGCVRVVALTLARVVQRAA